MDHHTRFVPLKLILFIGVLVPRMWAVEPDGGKGQAATQVDFNRDIRPIFNQHCVACHGGVKQAGDLSFVYIDEAQWIAEPGDPDASELILRVTSSDDDRMPPPEHGPALPAEQIDLLKRWILQGAKWRSHWAFEAPVSSRPPAVATDWAESPIDPFVIKRMQAVGLQPNEPASPLRWLRRVSLDLVGLPPTVEQQDDFLKDFSKRGRLAKLRTVDRLLASPRFGERWASVWLDAVRYADSRGLGLDGRRTIWKYRDWVIDALNSDLPYDQFTVLQLAGDQLDQPNLDQVVATAGNRLTQTNEEGGTDDEMFRVEAVIDRVNTIWQTWQGLSFGCVQCHSHPYDPIQHDEYYRFFAFFNNTVDCDLSNDHPVASIPIDPMDYDRAESLDQRIRRLEDELWKNAFSQLHSQQWKPLRGIDASTNNSTHVEVVESDGVEEYHTVGTVAKSTTVNIQAALPDGLTQLTAIRFTGLPENLETAAKDSEWGFVLSHVKAERITKAGESVPIELATVVADEPRPLVDPNLSLNPKSSMGFGAYSRIHYPRSAAFVLAEPMAIQPDDQIKVSLAQNVFELGAFPLVANRGRVAVTGDPHWTHWWSDPTQQEVRRQLSELRRTRSSIPSVRIPVTIERPASFSRPTYVFDRGNYLSKTDLVTAAVPNFLTSNLDSDSPSTRLDAARWIASSENPLTARVAVNRIWAQLFGAGLVVTQEDFGSAGQPPSHPELLDDLADRFQNELDWSVKSLIRELVTSATYGQSGKATAEQSAKDPQNRFLSRGPHHRLTAETIRDQALAASGLLSNRAFGPPVFPPIPDGVWKPFQASDKWTTAPVDDGNRYRRSVYTYTKRSIPYPFTAAFDAPSREFCTVRRLPSNTPLQALMALNDATAAEAAAGLARRMQSIDGNVDERLTYGFRTAVCRPPQADELTALRDLFQREQQRHADRETGADDQAYWTVGSVLLNLDEVVTK